MDGTKSSTHTFRTEQKYLYRWEIDGFSCENATHEDILPSTTFECSFDSDVKFSGELVLEGPVCFDRLCKLTLTCDTQFLWLAYAYIWIGEEKPENLITTKCLNQSNNTKKILLSNYDTGECRLPQENVLIMCEIIYVDYAEYAVTSFSAKSEVASIKGYFTELLKNQQHADVTLKVDGVELMLHKCILAARSKVFAAMFEHDMQESRTNIVNISGSFEVFVEVLHFIYSDEVPRLSEFTVELLAASDMYDLQTLKSMCEDQLIKDITIQNAGETLILADLYRTEKLKARITSYIRHNAAKVTATEGWQKIIHNYPYLIREILVQNKAKK